MAVSWAAVAAPWDSSDGRAVCLEPNHSAPALENQPAAQRLDSLGWETLTAGFESATLPLSRTPSGKTKAEMHGHGGP